MALYLLFVSFLLSLLLLGLRRTYVRDISSQGPQKIEM